MATGVQPIRSQAQAVVAAIDLDQDDWYIVVRGPAGEERKILRDGAELAGRARQAAVVATEECRNELARVAPQLQPRFTPRLESIAKAFRKEIGDQPCLVLWIGRKQATCGLLTPKRVEAERGDLLLTLDGIFQQFAANIGSLHAWMSAPQREERQKQAAFENFVANLRDGTTLEVGTRWMKTQTAVPQSFVTDVFGRLRDSVDPQKRAAKMVLSGWASAAHWDLGKALQGTFPDLKLISRPNGSGFFESTTGLIDSAGADSRPSQPRSSNKPVSQTAVELPSPSQPTALGNVAEAGRELQPTPTTAANASQAPAATAISPDLRRETEDLQSSPIVRIAHAVAKLLNNMRPGGVQFREGLKSYTDLAAQSEKVAAAMEGGSHDALQKQVSGFRDAVAKLATEHSAKALEPVLDAANGNPAAVELSEQAGISFFAPRKGDVVSSSDVTIFGQTDAGKPVKQSKQVKVAGIDRRGYETATGVMRKPVVHVEYIPPNRGLRVRPRWVAVALIAIAAVVAWLLMKPRAFQLVSTIDAGEPLAKIWNPSSGALLAAQAAGSGNCKVRIWQSPDSSTPAILYAPCGSPVALSADGRLAAWNSRDGNVPALFNTSNDPVRTMGPLEHQHRESITALAFTPDGQALYSSSADGYVRKWNVQNGEFEKDLADDHDHFPLQALLVTGNVVAAGETQPPATDAANAPGARIKVWLPPNENLVSLEGAPAGVTAMAYDGVAGLFVAGTQHGEVVIWPITGYYGPSIGGRLRSSWQQQLVAEPVQSIVLAPGGRLFVSYAHSVRSWHYTGSKGHLEIAEDPVFSFGPIILGTAAVNEGQNSFLAVGGGRDDRSIDLWRIGH